MTCTDLQSERIRYRVILFSANGMQVLLVRNGMLLAFPQVELPRFQRTSPHVAAIFERDWGQEIICLFSLASEVDCNVGSCPRYYVAQALRCQHAWRGSKWVQVSALDPSQFQDKDEHDSLIACLARLNRPAASGPGPFEQLGWFSQLTAWIHERIAPFGLRLTGTFRQLNASPTFSLIRFETNEAAVWFKAVGEPNVHELPVSQYLALYYPAFVPKILAVHEEWNAWLAVEVSGTHLDEHSDIGAWTLVAKTLADLQIASMGNMLHLIEAGCRDVRADTLVEAVDPFFDAMANLMEQQTKLSPAPLARADLAALSTQVKGALSVSSSLDLVNTLGHLDFNPGNVIVSRDRCVLLDWAEACVGPPFLTFHFLLERLRRLHPLEKSWADRLLSEYSDPWRSFLKPREIREANAVAPLLAAFTYAAASSVWRDGNRLRDPNVAAYFRSLARRIQREANRWSSRASSTEILTA
jgi:hypothetical protein